jgi:hypothetical protein
MKGTLRAAGSAALEGVGAVDADGRFSVGGAIRAGLDWRGSAIRAGRAVVGDEQVRSGVRQAVGVVAESNPWAEIGVRTAEALSQSRIFRDAMGSAASRFAMSGGH